MKQSSLPITDRVRRALARADNERARLGAPRLSPHHVLWALFHENGSVCSSILRHLGFDPAIIRQRLGPYWQATGPAKTGFGEATLCARATDVASSLGHFCVDTAHLLLGILTEDSRATKLMRGVGVTFPAAYEATAQFWARAVS
jgi:ATP-dependent Clp protease ATP-binding subunit ClpB